MTLCAGLLVPVSAGDGLVLCEGNPNLQCLSVDNCGETKCGDLDAEGEEITRPEHAH